MLESQAAIAVGFNTNVQKDEHKTASVPQHILAHLDDSQKAMMTWFLQGLSKAQMAQNLGVETAVMQERFSALRQKLGVTDDCNLLCLVHGPADEKKLDAAAKKFGLTREEQKVLEMRLQGLSLRDVSDRLKRDINAVMQAVFTKTNTLTLPALFSAVHNGHDVLSAKIQTKTNGHTPAATPSVSEISVSEIRVRPAVSALPPAETKLQIHVHEDIEGIPPEIAEILTPRELQIAKYKLRGLGYKEIGDALDISEHTVADHIKRFYYKLEIHDENAFFNLVYGDIYPKELKALAKHYNMTNAEEDVVGRILSGLSVEKAADDLKLSKFTISDHIRSVHLKMNVHGRDEIFFTAHEFIAQLRTARDAATHVESAAEQARPSPG